ncbi:16S rRNA (uracil(1498)-N(3))-methyltransferase [Clostridium niameyense]|uniref:Ribosomal RNA small subunit methyltransferase E n=1 Tax=Clostridium niameyense TaxID=1622073 RepID=A0A6M0R669_9CLOT|nr:16S rRNA (uracil(1498)-N(3))-methyltransferase [Clostridium niameyense]NEZ45704.1 16S rRNA (uracil(1498)-N(3))-methyltransferase [Clostridium niameyense]
MHKFFVPSDNIQENTVYIEGEDVKHIYKVLRLNVGDTINVNNCKGTEYEVKINDINKKVVSGEIIKKIDINNESPLNIYLYQGLPKSTKMDFIVQKGTELGIKEVIPIITKRVVVKGDLKEFKKLDRWNRIALESCKQCKRSFIPKVRTPITFEELIENIKLMDLILVPYENKENYGIKKVMEYVAGQKDKIKNIAIIIGPEGGFEEEEINILESLKAHIITLGPRIFRTETAGIICSTIISYELGDLGGSL